MQQNVRKANRLSEHRQQEGEAERKQQKISQRASVGRDPPQQGRNEIKPDDHIKKPELIRPGQKIGDQAEHAPVAEKKRNGIDRRPEDKGDQDVQDVFGKQPPQAYLAALIQKQRAADHDKNRRAPAGDRAEKAQRVPLRGVHVHAAPSPDGDVDHHDRHGRGDAKHIQIGHASPLGAHRRVRKSVHKNSPEICLRAAAATLFRV